MRAVSKKSGIIALCAVALMVAGMVPAAADPVDAGRGSSYGITAALAGTPLLDQQPACEAAIPPEAQAFCEETLVEVPLEGVLESGTLRAENEVIAAGGLPGRLQQKRVDIAGAGVLPDDWNVASYAITEQLSVLDGTATAELIESESVAGCVDGQPAFGSSANVGNLALAETEVLQPILDALAIDLSPALNLTQAPNTQVVDLSPLIKITFWETNWDGATGTTDGSDTVFTNALHIQVLGGLDEGGAPLPLPDLLGGLVSQDAGGEVQVQQQETGTIDIIVSHSEASANCDAGDPLEGVTKTASDDVVAPGSTFDYTIDVPNAGPCTLTDVNVTDTITGPAGSAITATNPPADNIDGLVATWNDIGPIAPGDNVRLTITVSVPETAQTGDTYAEQLRITANCDGRPVDGGLDFTGPTVGAPAAPSGPGAPLPRTGATAMLAGLAFMAAGAGLLRFRR